MAYILKALLRLNCELLASVQPWMLWAFGKEASRRKRFVSLPFRHKWINKSCRVFFITTWMLQWYGVPWNGCTTICSITSHHWAFTLLPMFSILPCSLWKTAICIYVHRARSLHINSRTASSGWILRGTFVVSKITFWGILLNIDKLLIMILC